MRTDYDLFKSQLKQLEDEDRELLEGFLLGKHDYFDLAEKNNIQYHSAVQKIRHIKVIVKNSFLEYKAFEVELGLRGKVN